MVYESVLIRSDCQNILLFLSMPRQHIELSHVDYGKVDTFPVNVSTAASTRSSAITNGNSCAPTVREYRRSERPRQPQFTPDSHTWRGRVCTCSPRCWWLEGWRGAGVKEGHTGNRECCVLLGAVVGSVSHESAASGASRNRSTTRCAQVEVCSL